MGPWPTGVTKGAPKRKKGERERKRGRGKEKKEKGKEGQKKKKMDRKIIQHNERGASGGSREKKIQGCQIDRGGQHSLTLLQGAKITDQVGPWAVTSWVRL